MSSTSHRAPDAPTACPWCGVPAGWRCRGRTGESGERRVCLGGRCPTTHTGTPIPDDCIRVRCPQCGALAGDRCTFYGRAAATCRSRPWIHHLLVFGEQAAAASPDPSARAAVYNTPVHTSVSVHTGIGGLALRVASTGALRDDECGVWVQLHRPASTSGTEAPAVYAGPLPGQSGTEILRQIVAAWAEASSPGTQVAQVVDLMDHYRLAERPEVAALGSEDLLRCLPAIRHPDPYRRDGMWRYPGPDGRFTVDGATEPYPLAWPEKPLAAAYAGDLSALWPYM